MTDKPHITYFGMGPWPFYMGCTTNPKAFKREMKRLNITDPPRFVSNDRSNATMHTFVADGTMTCIICVDTTGTHSPEQYAGLLAHEAVHVAQQLWENIGETAPGHEAEAYLVQMITQCCMQTVLKTGRVRKVEP